jgi:hypothetical protein
MALKYQPKHKGKSMSESELVHSTDFTPRLGEPNMLVFVHSDRWSTMEIISSLNAHNLDARGCDECRGYYGALTKLIDAIGEHFDDISYKRFVEKYPLK